MNNLSPQDQKFREGAQLGAELFRETQALLLAKMKKHTEAGGNPREVAVGFFSAYAGWFVRHIGLFSTLQLLKDVAKIAKKSAP